MEDCRAKSGGAKGNVLSCMKGKLWRHYVRELISADLQSFQSTVVIDAFAGSGDVVQGCLPSDIESCDSSIITVYVALEELIEKKRIQAKFDPARLQDYNPKAEETLKPAGKLNVSVLSKKTITIYFLNSKLAACLELFHNVCRVFACYGITPVVQSTQCEAISISCYDRHFPIVAHIICVDFCNFEVPSLSDKTRALTLLDPSNPCRLPMSKIENLIQFRYEIFINFPLRFVDKFAGRFPAVLLDMYGLTLPKAVAQKDKDFISQYVYNMVTFNSYGLHKTKEEVLLKNYERSLTNRSGQKNVVTHDVLDTRTHSKLHFYHVMEDLTNFRTMKEETMESTQGEQNAMFSSVQFIHNGKVQWVGKGIDNSNLANEIFEHFQGKSAEVRHIELYVWLRTPFIFRKSALALMESETRPRIISVLNNSGIDPRRRKGIYPDEDLIVTFRPFSMEEEFEQLRS